MRWLRSFSKSGGTIVHLTMYGKPWNEITDKIPLEGEVSVVVGGTKVPGELFGVSQLQCRSREPTTIQRWPHLLYS